MQESEKLWLTERNLDTPLNLAATCYLAMAGTMNGTDQLAGILVQDSRSMAIKMNLFGVPPTNDLITTFQQLSVKKMREFSHAAWGTYAWLT
jgi:hypothetical protein